MKWRIVKRGHLYKVQTKHWFFWTFGFWKDVKETRYIGIDGIPVSDTLYFDDLNKAKDLLINEYIYYCNIRANRKKKKNSWEEVASLNSSDDYDLRDVIPSDKIIWRDNV